MTLNNKTNKYIHVMYWSILIKYSISISLPTISRQDHHWKISKYYRARSGWELTFRSDLWDATLLYFILNKENFEAKWILTIVISFLYLSLFMTTYISQSEKFKINSMDSLRNILSTITTSKGTIFILIQSESIICMNNSFI